MNMFSKASKVLAGLLVAGLVGTAAYATVTVDENGVGFVGKGVIQDVYGLNNAGLQAIGDQLEFRFIESTTSTWECDQFQNHSNQGTRLQHTNTATVIAGVTSNVAVDARKNRQGQITGFNLNGWDGLPEVITTGDLAPGTCPEPHGNIFYVYVEGSLTIRTPEDDAVLEVSVDGIEWTAVELPLDD
jgi:hypothetical protein